MLTFALRRILLAIPTLLFISLVIFLLLGYPVTFALGANCIIFGMLGIYLGLLQPALFQALPERLFGIMSNDVLMAVPFFTFMGLILERSGMAEDLLETVGQLFGNVRGGLAAGNSNGSGFHRLRLLVLEDVGHLPEARLRAGERVAEGSQIAQNRF